MRQPDGSHAQRMALPEHVLGVTTRGMARPASEASPLKILPNGVEDSRDASEKHALPEVGVAEAESVDNVEANERVNPVPRIPTSLESLMLHLQSQDD